MKNKATEEKRVWEKNNNNKNIHEIMVGKYSVVKKGHIHFCDETEFLMVLLFKEGRWWIRRNWFSFFHHYAVLWWRKCCWFDGLICWKGKWYGLTDDGCLNSYFLSMQYIHTYIWIIWIHRSKIMTFFIEFVSVVFYHLIAIFLNSK